jgi:hypothetical protein
MAREAQEQEENCRTATSSITNSVKNRLGMEPTAVGGSREEQPPEFKQSQQWSEFLATDPEVRFDSRRNQIF